MTSSEKRVFLLGAGAGVAAALLIGGVVAMRSTHVFASQPADAAAPAEARSAARLPASEPEQGTPPGTTLQLTPSEITAAGVQVATVRSAVLKTNIDAFGRVEQPESQLAAVSAWIGGRVDKLYVQYTGERVRRGQPVAEVYSPEVATALEEYRLAAGKPRPSRAVRRPIRARPGRIACYRKPAQARVVGHCAGSDRFVGQGDAVGIRRAPCDHLRQRHRHGGGA